MVELSVLAMDGEKQLCEDKENKHCCLQDGGNLGLLILYFHFRYETDISADTDINLISPPHTHPLLCYSDVTDTTFQILFETTLQMVFISLTKI